MSAVWSSFWHIIHFFKWVFAVIFLYYYLETVINNQFKISTNQRQIVENQKIITDNQNELTRLLKLEQKVDHR